MKINTRFHCENTRFHCENILAYFYSKSTHLVLLSQMLLLIYCYLDLQSKPTEVNKDFVSEYYVYFKSMTAHFQDYLNKDMYEEHNGIPEQIKQITISKYPALEQYLAGRVSYWMKAASDVRDLWDTGNKASITFYETLAKCTNIRLACLCPKLFAVVCDSLRHGDFSGENQEELQAINILEMTCREWLLVY